MPGIIVQFAKAPVLGRVKTRLQPFLTAHQSVALHQQLLLHCHNRLCNLGQAQLLLGVDDTSHPYWQQPALASTSLWQQPQGDLGQRMAACFSDLLTNKKFDWVILVGSDCPGISSDTIVQTIGLLEQGAPLVIGPATDGGYVLIAMSRPCPVFEGVEWGSERVLSQTLGLALRGAIAVAQLMPLSDIDRPEDLPLLQHYPHLARFSQNSD